MIIHLCGQRFKYSRGFFWDMKMRRRLTHCPKCGKKLEQNGPGQGGNNVIRPGTREYNEIMGQYHATK